MTFRRNTGEIQRKYRETTGENTEEIQWKYHALCSFPVFGGWVTGARAIGGFSQVWGGRGSTFKWEENTWYYVSKQLNVCRPRFEILFTATRKDFNAFLLIPFLVFSSNPGNIINSSKKSDNTRKFKLS